MLYFSEFFIMKRAASKSTFVLDNLPTVEFCLDCPKFGAVLQSTDEAGISVDELGYLRSDLETLLAFAMKRNAIIEQKLEELDQLEPGTVPTVPQLPPTPTTSPGPTIPQSRTKNRSKNDNNGIDPKSSLQSETVEKLWKLVDEYCIPVTPRCIQAITKLLQQQESYSDLYVIPPFMPEETDDDHRSPHAKKKKGSLSSSHTNGEMIGPLTMRLIGALVTDYMPSDNVGRPSTEAVASMPLSTFARQLHLPNAYYLENKVKQELEEAGLLETAVVPDDEGDPIATELKKAQKELSRVAQNNKDQLKNFLEIAKKEEVKASVGQRLHSLEAQILDTYESLTRAKQNRKVSVNKERETLHKLISEWNSLAQVFLPV